MRIYLRSPRVRILQYGFANQSHTLTDHEDVKCIVDPGERREKQQQIEDDISNKGYQCGYYGGVCPRLRSSPFHIESRRILLVQ